MDEHALWPPERRLLVAVSGGPDSTALLLILQRLAGRRGVGLTLAHFDHGLRGPATAEREAGFVGALAGEMGLALIVGRGDVRGLARTRRLSLEDAARQARYEFLAGAGRDAGCSFVATGHTAGDQAETVLLHLLRGSGIGGLAAMAPRGAFPAADNERLTLVRPLLRLSRDETAAYCEASGLRPVEDESNLSSAFRRNRVRIELLPALRTFNPRIEDALVRLADAARLDDEYLREIAEMAIRSRTEGRGIQLSRALLRSWHASPRRRALHLALPAAAGEVQGFSERHILALERLVLEGQTGDRLDLPQAVTARLTHDTLDLETETAPPQPLPEDGVCLTLPGEAPFGGLVVSGGMAAPAGTISAIVDAEAAGPTVCVRRRRPGDRFQPLGLAAPKKLQDFFVDARVPRQERDLVPIFESRRGIVWVGGLRIADWARPRPGHATTLLAYRPR